MRTLLMLALLTGSCLVRVMAQDEQPPHILLIVIDDLNAYLSPYDGHPQQVAPVLNGLASQGTVFTNAHAPAPKCMPSRVAIFTGKTPDYTGVYRNMACKSLYDYTENALFVLPQYLKDSAGYFTYGTGKILHCFDTYPEYDTSTENDCERSLSWNRYVMFAEGENPDIKAIGLEQNEGLGGLHWTPLHDSLEDRMWDHLAADSLIEFIHGVGNGTKDLCGRPVFMTLGLHKPHQPLYIPEKYFNSFYLSDFTQTPFRPSYNYPAGAYPLNGVIMPPQPVDGDYQDYFSLPPGGLGRFMADKETFINALSNKAEDLADIMDYYGPDETINVAEKSLRANFVIAYLAALAYLDAQVGRVMDALAAHPEIMENTIVIVASDHGYALGEKRHWQKGTMWETDLRVPFFIIDPREANTALVHTPVSLLDLYPTICSFAGVAPPVYESGEAYLDGHDLLPLMESEMPILEWPVLAAYQQQPGTEQASCFPQYSVRNKRFHFIRYASNGADWDFDCNEEESWREEELYEIGTYRETDPYEWNNLIDDNYYRPVWEYLQQWLPGGIMYMKRTYTTLIEPLDTSCIYLPDSQVSFYAKLYDSLGAPVDIPEGYSFRWTTTHTTDTSWGEELLLDLAGLEGRVGLYLSLVDPLGNIVSLDLYHMYIGDGNEDAELTFSIDRIDPMTVGVEEVISPSAFDITWDFGDGFTYNGLQPGPHTYAEPGQYTITASARFGNQEDCRLIYSQGFLAHRVDIDSVDLLVYPNPAHSYVDVFMPNLQSEARIALYNFNGQLVHSAIWQEGSETCRIDIAGFSNGIYAIEVHSDKGKSRGKLVVLH